ncbi:MAG TPA: hypothetical protein VF756_12350 [Thermoanaerobaculia bacterium]
MSLSAEVLDRAWEKVGMSVQDRSVDRWAYLFVSGKRVIATRRSRGSGKISGKIPHLIRQQMKLDENQFRDLVNCPLDREGYLKILHEKGLLG